MSSFPECEYPFFLTLFSIIRPTYRFDGGFNSLPHQAFSTFSRAFCQEKLNDRMENVVEMAAKIVEILYAM